MAKYSRSASKDVENAMERRKKGTLKSGPGGKGGTALGEFCGRELRGAIFNVKGPPRKKCALI